MQIITISNLSTMQYFFTTDHCQDHGLGDDWVPCTYKLPGYVEPRACVPDGYVRTKEDYVNVFLDDMQEIPNPNSNYQP